MKTPTLMLTTLKLQNFATFKSHEVNFHPGLNAIIGETGSGKSLLLDALQLVFGGRADKKSVRQGTDAAVVEAVMSFHDEEIGRALEEMGFPCEDQEVVIKRMVKKDGTSKCWLNHMTCSLSQVVTLTRRYVDLVGQFENQKLLSDSYQLSLLDQFGGLSAEVRAYQTQFQELTRTRRELAELERSTLEREQRMDYLEYQLNEIEMLAPKLGEEEELVQMKSDFLNFERRQAIQEQLRQMMEGGEQGIGLTHLLRNVRALMSKNRELFPEALHALWQQSELSLEEFTREFAGLKNTELDEAKLNEVVERLDFYQRLKRKFGGSTERLLETRETFAEELARLKGQQSDHTELQQKLVVLESKLARLADKLHAERVKKAKEFSSALTQAVRNLKMGGAEIELTLERATELTDTGHTKLSFLAQTNPGEGFFKVKDIASGGELSRILLALRQLLSSHDSISIFLFDEIDTGMGGETALHIGKSLKKVSQESQVVTITHLPQIAQFADWLIVVYKETVAAKGEDRTESRARLIGEGAKMKKEIEAMMPLH